MLNSFKFFLITLYSYLRPVNLGTHFSTDGVMVSDAVTVDNLLGSHIRNNTPKTTRQGKSETISFTEPINISLKPDANFELLSIIISKSNNSKDLVRIKDKSTNQVFRISMNTFRALFTLSGI